MEIYAFDNIFIGTAQKKYVKNAIKEIQRLDPDVKIIDRYPEGIFTFQLSTPKESLIYNLMSCPPIFLRHIHPIDRMFFIPLEGSIPDIIAEATTSLFSKIQRSKKTAVQARRIPGDYEYSLFSIKKSIDPIIGQSCGAISTVKNPEQIISIYVADSTEINYRKSINCTESICNDADRIPRKGVCFMGVSTPRENLVEWSGGEIRFTREADQKSRAEFKLLEAFEVFPINPRQDGLALDLGASPGGWTRILYNKGYYVTAVDRAPLDSDLLNIKKIRQIQQDALHFRDKPDKYDILTNDINRDPNQSAKIMVAASSHLKPASPFIMTIKLPGSDPEKTIKSVVNKLESVFNINSIRQLYHNRDEVTVWGNKK